MDKLTKYTIREIKFVADVHTDHRSLQKNSPQILTLFVLR